MSLPDFEDAALDAAMDAEPQAVALTPTPTDIDARAAIEGAAPAIVDDQQPEPHRPAGDLSVALRQERERNKEIQAELKREREERARIVAMFERSQPQQPKQPDPAPEKVPTFWENPDAYLENQLKQRLTPYEAQLAETREYYSRRAAVSEHGEDTVTAAYEALGKAIEAGQLNGPQIVASLRQNADPFGEIVKWHQNRPEAREQKLRTTLEAEIMAKYGLTPETPPANPAPAAPAPGTSPLPSLNQANGNAGNQQPASLSEEDIFNATPAFGKRKA